MMVCVLILVIVTVAGAGPGTVDGGSGSGIVVVRAGSLSACLLGAVSVSLALGCSPLVGNSTCGGMRSERAPRGRASRAVGCVPTEPGKERESKRARMLNLIFGDLEDDFLAARVLFSGRWFPWR